MNNAVSSMLLLAALSVSWCAESSAMIKDEVQSGRSGIQEERGEQGTLPQKEAALEIVSSLKTHAPRPSFVHDTHGTADFQITVGIDGQTVALRGAPTNERYTSNDLADPENGSGIRYRFSNTLRLKSGTHRVVVSLPGDRIRLERDVELIAGKRHTLVLEPVYENKAGKPRLGVASKTSFREGIRTFRISLDGEASR